MNDFQNTTNACKVGVLSLAIILSTLSTPTAAEQYFPLGAQPEAVQEIKKIYFMIHPLLFRPKTAEQFELDQKERQFYARMKVNYQEYVENEKKISTRWFNAI